MRRLPEAMRIELFTIAAASIRAHLSDILRSTGGETQRRAPCASCSSPGVTKIAAAATKLIRSEVRSEAVGAARPADRARRERRTSCAGWCACSSSTACSGSRRLAARKKLDELALTRAYTRLGEALGLDWAQQQVARFVPADQWERLLTAGLARDFEQLRIDFLARARSGDPDVVRRASGSSARPRASTSSGN